MIILIKYPNELDSYKEVFTRPFWDKRLYYESTPNYLYHTESAKILKDLKPDLKFIVLQRDPIERAYSAWNMFRSNYELQKKNNERLQKHLLEYVENDQFMSFEMVALKELSYLEDKLKSDKGGPFTLLRKGLYQQQLDEWYQCFPKENFFIGDFKDFIEEPIEVLNSVADFLDISSFDGFTMDLKPRNQRKYKMDISEDLQVRLNKFFIN